MFGGSFVCHVTSFVWYRILKGVGRPLPLLSFVLKVFYEINRDKKVKLGL